MITYGTAAHFVARMTIGKFKSMAITEQNAASRSQAGAAMGNKKDLPPKICPPETEDEAVDAAVKDMLKAAHLLCTAADMAQDGDIVGHYINSAIRLRDLANSISPDKPEWPANVIPFVPRQA